MTGRREFAAGELVLLHDPADRPEEWRTKREGRPVGYHWAIFQATTRACFRVVVDWRGDHIDDENSLAVDDIDKFIVIETHQPTVEGLVMAAIHLPGPKWHDMLDRKYPWAEIDKSYGDNWRAYR